MHPKGKERRREVRRRVDLAERVWDAFEPVLLTTVYNKVWYEEEADYRHMLLGLMYRHFCFAYFENRNDVERYKSFLTRMTRFYDYAPRAEEREPRRLWENRFLDMMLPVWSAAIEQRLRYYERLAGTHKEPPRPESEHDDP